MVTRHQARPLARRPSQPERLHDIISRWMAGVSAFGLCRACWCRQDLSEGSRCLRCGGVVIRVRPNA